MRRLPSFYCQLISLFMTVSLSCLYCVLILCKWLRDGIQYCRQSLFAKIPLSIMRKSGIFDPRSVGYNSFCNSLGREKPSSLTQLALPISKLHLLSETAWSLIYFIAHIPGHADIWWHEENIVDQVVRDDVSCKINQFNRDDVVRLFCACKKMIGLSVVILDNASKL